MKHSTGKIGLFPLMLALAMAALFTACGDEITEVTQVNESAGIEVLAAGDTLGDCTKDNAGEMLFVTDSSAVYYCADGKWQTLNGIDGKPGENGNDGKPGENGKNGVDGAPGEQGAAGESCTAKSVETGVEISCGGVVVDTLTNGVSSMGDTGPGCSVGAPSTDKDGNTVVTVTCGETSETLTVAKGGKGESGAGCTVGESSTDKDGNTVVTVTCGETSETLTVAKGDKGETGAGCTVGAPSTDKDGNTVVTVTCGETSETLTVAKGGKGESGAGCTVGESSTDKDGNTVVTVTCGESKETLTIAKGNSGEAGVGCKAEDKGDGKVVVTCGEGESKTEQTLFKAVCGSINFEPANAFCLEGKIYSCDNKPYNPAEQYCLSVKDEEGAEKKTVEELLIDDRDKDNVQIYKTIEICDDKDENCQTWMAENLNYRYVGVKYNYDGYTSDSTSWCGGGSGTTAGDCSIYGRLYTWAAAVDSVAIYEEYGEECGYGKSCPRFSASALATAPVRGVCPSGWHLPSDAEWSALYTNVGGTGSAGQKLKANTGLWYGNMGTDEYGFSVLPAGSRRYYGDFSSRDYYAYFWSSTEDEDNSNYAWNQYFYCYDGTVSQDDRNKYVGFSVRCLKDSF